MTIALDALTASDDLEACEALQIELFGPRSHAILWRPALVSLLKAGGLLLGAWKTSADGSRQLLGVLVDAVARINDFAARVTLLHGVLPQARDQGIGTALRLKERELLRCLDVALVAWWIDPLRGIPAHQALHRLGAIAVAYDRHVYGNLSDRPNLGLATDRLFIEWWLDSPRVVDRVDRNAPSPHDRIGLQHMQVATTSRISASGTRRLLSVAPLSEAPYVLVEIPEDLDRLLDLDPTAAREWRIGTRASFEDRLANGYVGSGFLHEAGRSFHLLERETRGGILGQSTGSPMHERGD